MNDNAPNKKIAAGLDANTALEEATLMTKSTMSSRLLVRAAFQLAEVTEGGLHDSVFERTNVAGVAVLIRPVLLL